MVRQRESKKDTVAGCACFNLRKAARAVTQAYDAALQPAGLRATQFSVLAVLAKEQPIRMTQLAEKLAMDRTTLTRNLGPLRRRGLVRSDPGEDSRVRVVSLTESGHRALAEALPAWRRAQQAFAQAVGEVGFARLLADLEATQSAYGGGEARER